MSSLILFIDCCYYWYLCMLLFSVQFISRLVLFIDCSYYWYYLQILLFGIILLEVDNSVLILVVIFCQLISVEYYIGLNVLRAVVITSILYFDNCDAFLCDVESVDMRWVFNFVVEIKRGFT